MSLPVTFSNICNSAILDARLGFEMKVGSPITCGFTVEANLKRWPKLALPKSAELIPIAPELESGNISVHFEEYDNNQTGNGGTR